MIDHCPPNFKLDETHAGHVIYKHINHDVWAYPGENFQVFISIKYLNKTLQGRHQILSKEEYEKLLFMLDVI